jgi:hypothetical protein
MRSVQIRGRARWLALLASGMLVGGLGIQSVSAAKPVAPTFVDYAQCANGAPTSPQLVVLDCPDGWINGILQASNSHYTEDQVTPQRAELNLPSGASTAVGSHSMTFTYQARKGSAQTHAYDSLATWNWTQTNAPRCGGLATTGPNPDCVISGGVSTLPIPPDNTALEPHAGASTTSTAPHMLPASTQAECDAFATTIPSRCFIMYGGILDSTGSYTHSCTATSSCLDPSVDDYATITVNFHTTSTPQKVQLLFGGHLALGSSGGSRTWGLGNGASDISGGPYHIKWEAADGASIGNRDNQIMGSAIIFNDTSNTTTLMNTNGTSTTTDDTSIGDGGSVSVGTVVYDTVTLSGASGAGGTVSYYYKQTTTADCTGGTLIGSAVAVTSGVAPASATVSLGTAGTYEFWAVYSGDPTHGSSTSQCGSETVVVNPATNSISTGQSLVPNDTATLGGLTSGAGGTITFQLFAPDNPTCDTSATAPSAPIVDETQDVSGGTSQYTTNNSTAVTDEGTYKWLVVYTGDTNNGGATSDCGAEAFTLDNDTTN